MQAGIFPEDFPNRAPRAGYYSVPDRTLAAPAAARSMLTTVRSQTQANPN